MNAKPEFKTAAADGIVDTAAIEANTAGYTSRVIKADQSVHSPARDKGVANVMGAHWKSRVQVRAIEDAELDQLVRWHKFKFKTYPNSETRTPVVALGADGWSVRMESWAAIATSRRVHGLSSIEDFCKMRNYIDRPFIPDTAADENEDTESAGPDKSPGDTILTDKRLLQLLVWHKEKTGDPYPRKANKQKVWVRGASGAWEQGQENWDTLRTALANQVGVETYCRSFEDFLASKKPEITPELVRNLLVWSLEFNGRYGSSESPLPVMMKQEDGSWERTLLQWNEIDYTIRKNADKFGAASLAKFKIANGFRGTDPVPFSMRLQIP